MTHRPLTFALLLGAAGLALLLASCSLAEDVTPPARVSVPAQGGQPVAAAGAQIQPTPQGFPASRPSAIRGAIVYSERCAACHGPTGGGDGERAAQLPNKPAVLADPQLARKASPARWFQTVTQGNLDKFMPPFVEALSDAQRWDAVFYLFTLSASPGQAEQGRALYDANCAGCHGPQGAGDGPEASAGMPDLTGQALMAAKSEADLFEAISSSQAHAASGFGASLSEDQRWTLASFLRTFTFDLHATVAG
ncbi:MAG: c-type cytochrome [Chloroflexi bacterium]|nr:c-type cytochrome [Chloroflexota bacterium]